MEKPDWKVSKCDYCGICPLFLFSCFCPCIVQGVTIWEQNKQGGCGECLIACCCLSIGMSLNREKTRANYKIKGNCISDCLMFCCCMYSCLTTQEYLHVIRSKIDIN